MKSLPTIREAIFLAIANHLPRSRVADRVRRRLCILAGMGVGGSTTIWGPITLRPICSARNVRIGRGVFINTEVRFGANAAITIGDNVAIGPRVSLETTGHGLVHVPGTGRGTFSAPIHVQDRVWLGAGVIVMPGVTIGHDSVVAAGAVVTRNVAPWTLCGGVPARVIRLIGPGAGKEAT